MTGYRGRLAVHESFVMDDAFRQMIIQRLPAVEYKRHAVKNGMVLMFDDALLKVRQGLTTLEEIYRIALPE